MKMLRMKLSQCRFGALALGLMGCVVAQAQTQGYVEPTFAEATLGTDIAQSLNNQGILKAGTYAC